MEKTVHFPEIILQEVKNDQELYTIATKVKEGTRISESECLALFERGSLNFVGALANYIRFQKHGDKVYFNKNFHIEPTNVCIFKCDFCAYSETYKDRTKGWELSIEEMLNIVKKYDGQPVTEVHIVGGVHPKMNMAFFEDLLRQIKAHRPELFIKGFTAVELDYMFRKAHLSPEEGLRSMMEAGLQSLPGGGAEIFAQEIRDQICADKVGTEGWFAIHEAAHKLGMKSNATMLYGHIETYAHRVEHMSLLRNSQDKINGFDCFIPLKFRNGDNDMSNVPEATVIEDLRMYAIARIFMDNFDNLKAYWPMIGRDTAQLTLDYGVNDLDGTIDDTTKIYSLAGAEEQVPTMSTEQLCTLISSVGKVPVERDSSYNELHVFTEEEIHA